LDVNPLVQEISEDSLGITSQMESTLSYRIRFTMCFASLEVLGLLPYPLPSLAADLITTNYYYNPKWLLLNWLMHKQKRDFPDANF